MTRLLVLPGDGIGPEVVEPAVDLLDTLAPEIELLDADAGRPARRTHDDPLAPTARQAIEDGTVDGVLFGAATTPPGSRSAAIELRELAQARVSIRPVRHPDDPTGPPALTVYRELTEGLYAANGRREDGHAEVTRRITRTATRAFARTALDHAPPEQALVVAHKANVLDRTDGLFLDTVQAVADERGRELSERIVDALAHDLTLHGLEGQAILAPNLHGDLLSDMAAGLTGGLGLAASLTIGEGPPIGEPVHGSAPDIAGTGQANPTAMLASLALLLDELGHTRQARHLEAALHTVLARGEPATPDLGGQASTQALADAVIDELQAVIA